MSWYTVCHSLNCILSSKISYKKIMMRDGSKSIAIGASGV